MQEPRKALNRLLGECGQNVWILWGWAIDDNDDDDFDSVSFCCVLFFMTSVKSVLQKE